MASATTPIWAKDSRRRTPGVTGSPGKYVELEDTIKSFDGLVKGEYDHLPEAAFYMVGGIEEAIEKAKKLEAEAA